MQHTYEVMFIVRPDLSEEDVDKVISSLESALVSAGGTMKNVERMGKRRLAYDVRRFKDGIYVLFVIEADAKALHELERRMRVTEQVIKFLSVRVDEEQKRLEKIRQIRATRTKRSAETAAAAPQGAQAGETAVGA